MELRRRFKFISIITTLIMSLAGQGIAAETFYDSLIGGKISGEGKIWYQTNDSDANKHIFDSENSVIDAGLRLSY